MVFSSLFAKTSQAVTRKQASSQDRAVRRCRCGHDENKASASEQMQGAAARVASAVPVRKGASGALCMQGGAHWDEDVAIDGVGTEEAVVTSCTRSEQVSTLAWSKVRHPA